MKAIVIDQYGPAEVLTIETQSAPSAVQLGSQELLIEVHATSVTTADWRFRAAAFPLGMRLLGRLVAGLFRPRNRLTGREFSGRVVAVGSLVNRFQPGDEVFGAHGGGVNAERIIVPESAALAKKPANLSHAEAAALPFGAITSVTFLRDMAKIQPGERVLIVGASGGVGVYAVQIAKQLGAHVTAICSGGKFDLVRSLGADELIDYTEADPRDAGLTWDVIIDPVGKSRFRDYRHLLRAGGRHVFIEAGPREIWQSIVTPWMRGPTVLFGISEENSKTMENLAALVEAGELAPVIGHRLPMTEVVEAHRIVDRRRRRGAVILDWPAASAPSNKTIPLRRAG